MLITFLKPVTHQQPEYTRNELQMDRKLTMAIDGSICAVLIIGEVDAAAEHLDSVEPRGSHADPEVHLRHHNHGEPPDDVRQVAGEALNRGVVDEESRRVDADQARGRQVVLWPCRVIDYGMDLVCCRGLRAVHQVDEDALVLHLGAALAAGVGRNGEVEPHPVAAAQRAARGVGDEEADAGRPEDCRDHDDNGGGGQGSAKSGEDVVLDVPCFARSSHGDGVQAWLLVME
ncbi:hypothetical protein C2845_PM06G29320 [Panicum miliaceum]|uniref:Uncharacterized protein n=1 Tax=Panicum miliaceum TaxID=4540 RepID=A0A3L6RBY3_PANMI|nr:hypothetical protein C2845_PM06G29320 [Panicum miliaceum]